MTTPIRPRKIGVRRKTGVHRIPHAPNRSVIILRSEPKGFLLQLLESPWGRAVDSPEERRKRARILRFLRKLTPAESHALALALARVARITAPLRNSDAELLLYYVRGYQNLCVAVLGEQSHRARPPRRDR